MRFHPIIRRSKGRRAAPTPQGTGTFGLNDAPGSGDDGWTPPPPVKLSDGTYLQLFKDGQAWAAAFAAMKRARFRICLELYIFASDDTGRAVADLLCEKARAGVAVFLIYDSFGSAYSDPAMFQTMSDAGVHVLEFHPMNPWRCRHNYRPWNRDHRKLIVIDDDVAGLGGMNLGADYAGSWIVKKKLTASPAAADSGMWRDNAVGLYGPAAASLFESFCRTWWYTARGGKIGRAQLMHNIHHGEFGVLASVPTTDSPLQPALCRLFADARVSIHLTMAYFAPDDRLIDELCDAARRGVKIRLMLPGRGDVKLLVTAARSYYEKLMAAGMDIYERQNVVLHAKTMVVDGHTTIIGSTNLDYRSIEYNCELSAAIRSMDFGRQMELLFENDIRFAKKIDPADWQHRPVLDRFVQWGVSRARYLL